MSSSTHWSIALIASALVAGCGGGGASAPEKTPAPPAPAPAPPAGPVMMSITGQVAPSPATKSALVYAYSAAGSPCENRDATPLTVDGKDVYPKFARGDAKGAYKLSVDPKKCLAPVFLYADIPDGNDATDAPDAPSREGRKYYNFITSFPTDSSAAVANLNPSTSSIAAIVTGRLPAPTDANPANILSDARRQAAVAKLKTALDPIAKALSLSISDYANPSLEPDSALSKLFSVVTTSIQRVESTNQTLIRFYLPSEHRPIVLVVNDAQPIDSASFDTGLGVHPSAIDTASLAQAVSVQQELQALLQVNPSSFKQLADYCFLHNGDSQPSAAFDLPPGWMSESPVENVQLLRLNTYVDFENETREIKNIPGSDLAYVSYDFRNQYGFKQRGYTWLIRGQKTLGSCTAGDTSRWTLLGNQRPVYLNTTTKAVRETSFGAALTDLSRRDAIGTGTEHYIHLPPQSLDYVMATVEGPGLPTNGAVFFRLNGSFLYSTTPLKEIQQKATAALANNNGSWLTGVINTVKDTRMYNMNDIAIKRISDTFFDSAQNQYTYRFYRRYHDTYPSLTLLDTLPKRPYLLAELSHSYFPTLALNKDKLVQAMQLLEPVQINWQLPPDTRSVDMVPEAAFFMRMNCITPTKWPACSMRSDQYNEYTLSYTPYPFSSPTRTDDIIVPGAFPIAGLHTNKAYARLIVRDSLNRPIEARFGVDYTR